jgi:hypothetical protein
MAALDKITYILFGDEEDYDDDQMTQFEEYLDNYMKSTLEACNHDIDKAMKRSEALAKRSVIAFYRAVQEIDSKANSELTAEESMEYAAIVTLLAEKMVATGKVAVDFAGLQQDLENVKLALRDVFEELSQEMQAEIELPKPRPRF